MKGLKRDIEGVHSDGEGTQDRKQAREHDGCEKVVRSQIPSEGLAGG